MPRSLFGFPLMFLFVLAIDAQYTTGQLEGVGMDPKTATVADAKINLTSLDTNAARTFTTKADGFYSFAAVPPGKYRLSIEKDGFRAASADVTVYTSQTTTQNFGLELGAQ